MFGLLAVQTLPNIYEKQGLAEANGVFQVEKDRPYRLLVANQGVFLEKKSRTNWSATSLHHPTSVVSSPILLGEVLSIIEERKQNFEDSHQQTDDQCSNIEEQKPKTNNDKPEPTSLK